MPARERRDLPVRDAHGLVRHLSALAFLCASAGGAAQTPPDVSATIATCDACHGAAAVTTQKEYPILAGQTARYLYLELRDFNEGRRSNPLMSPMAASLTRDQMRVLADHYASLKPPRQDYAADADKASLGKAKSAETLCTMCHLGGFIGQNEIPRVAGQNFAYITKQLADFKARRRTNDAGSMTSVAATLSDEDIQNLAHYLVGL